MGGDDADARVDLVAMGDDGADEFAGKRRRCLVTLRFGKVALEDGLGRALPEVGLEDRREGESSPRATASLLISLRRHRR